MKKVIWDDALKGSYSDVDAGVRVDETVDYKQVASLGGPFLDLPSVF